MTALRNVAREYLYHRQCTHEHGLCVGEGEWFDDIVSEETCRQLRTYLAKAEREEA